jgi:hypothetical protein
MVVRVSGILTGHWNLTHRTEVSRAILGLVFSTSGVWEEEYADGGKLAIRGEPAVGWREETE